MPDAPHFYLTGGTALAEFYLGHRFSFDLDLFTSEEGLILPVSYQIEARASQAGLSVTVSRRFATFVELLVGQVGEQIKVELALDSPYRFEAPLPSELGVAVRAYRDLIVDKVLAYYGRAEPRDAVDLYFILRQESAATLLTLAAQKDPGFDLYWFAVALYRSSTFPDEAERWPVKMALPFDPIAIKRKFQEWALELMDQVTGGQIR